MPFLRVIRDRRGYESTYLMELYRDGARQRSRILYVFRTPGDVRVGRTSLEPETQREIERLHPAISFDWNAVVGNQQIVEVAPELRRRKRRSDESEAGEDAGAAAPTARVAPGGIAAAPSQGRAAEGTSPLPAIPSSIEGDTPDEKIAFLGHWYPVCRDRIPLRIADTGRHPGLFALAERLNPAAWIDANQITEGLLQAAEALERLSYILGKRRRRARRGAGRAAAQTGSESLTADAVDQPGAEAPDRDAADEFEPPRNEEPVSQQAAESALPASDPQDSGPVRPDSH